MKRKRSQRFSAGFVTVCLTGFSWLAVVAFSQQANPSPRPVQPVPIIPDGAATGDPARDRLAGERARLFNDERHKRLQSDADKLLELTTELKQSVDKSTKNELSIDVVRRAAEIEKLAREIKEREKN